jgi:tetratricopeptide (TPR) repeat protein
MWTELYDRDVADFFAVQDEIALSVLTELKVQLMTGDSGLRVGTRNLGAYQLLHEGRRKMGRLSKAGIAEARGLYLQAVEIDPLYVGAWVTLGWSHLISANRGWSEDPQQDTELALKFAQKGRAINASASSPYSLLAAIAVRERRYDEAISYSEQAVALAPNDASAIALLARSLTFAGRAEEALAPIETVKRYTPIPPPLLLRWEGVVYHTLGRYEEAVVVLERADAANPNVFSRAWLALTHADMGHMQAAREAAASVLELSPVFSAKGFANAVMAYKDETRHKRNLAILLEVGLPE